MSYGSPELLPKTEEEKRSQFVNENTVFCPKCGERYNVGQKNCPNCNEVNHYYKEVKIGGSKKQSNLKWKTGRFVISIISFVIFAVFFLQSCAIATLGSFASEETANAGAMGLVSALFYIVAAIIGVVAKDKDSKGMNYACVIFYWIVYFFGCMGRANFPDMMIWGVIAYSFGCVFLLSSASTKKDTIISVVIAVVYLILGLI